MLRSDDFQVDDDASCFFRHIDSRVYRVLSQILGTGHVRDPHMSKASPHLEASIFCSFMLYKIGQLRDAKIFVMDVNQRQKYL